MSDEKLIGKPKIRLRQRFWVTINTLLGRKWCSQCRDINDTPGKLCEICQWLNKEGVNRR